MFVDLCFKLEKKIAMGYEKLINSRYIPEKNKNKI